VWFTEGNNAACTTCVEQACCAELKACAADPWCGLNLKACLDSLYVAWLCVAKDWQHGSENVRQACLTPAGLTDYPPGNPGNETWGGQAAQNLKTCIATQCEPAGCTPWNGHCESAGGLGGQCSSKFDCCDKGCCECEDGTCRSCVIGPEGLCSC
jgi:hypothetical protein